MHWRFPALAAFALLASARVSDGHAQKDAPAFGALGWLAPGHDEVAFLSTRPVECARPIADAVLARERDRGRAAFESPALLGGTAARRGISCSSCHINGRSNPDFFVAALSGAPGTADVTSNLFSKVRGDGVFNPKPIPDITARDGAQIKDRASAAFHAKVHGLIVEEFDGQEPAASVFEDVRLYLDSLTFSACPNPAAREPITAARDLAAIEIALDAARDSETAVFWLGVARRRLEKIDERFAGPGLAAPRRAIEAMSRRLGAAQESAYAGRAPAPLSAREWAAFERAIKSREAKSLYNPERLRAALGPV